MSITLMYVYLMLLHSMFLQVCHHTDCQDNNNHQPLMLCTPCDAQIHATPEQSGHLRLDTFRPGELHQRRRGLRLGAQRHGRGS